jgi:hypothetical protein
MIKVKINKIADQSISIEEITASGTVTGTFAADFRAKTDEPGLITIDEKTNKKQRTPIVVRFGEIEVNGKSDFNSIEETVVALNEFIGNFNNGGASSSTTERIREEVENQLQDVELTFDNF